MTKDEALRMALEALHGFIPYLPLQDEAQCGRYDQAITAIKEALAHPELCKYGQEPKSCTSSPMDCQCALDATFAQPEQEPVVWMYQDKSTHEVRFQKHMRDFVDHGATYETPLYTTPSQRTWVGLTDEDKQIAFDDTQEGGGFWEFADAIEAKLKEKNA